MTRVLLTEDEGEIRSMLAEVLVDAGYEVVEADSGDAAALLMDHSDAFDVLVTDIHMPGRLNGLDLGRKFRERHARSPILYVTGRPDAVRGIPMRPNREVVLLKPHGLLALVATVQVMLAAGFAGADEGVLTLAGAGGDRELLRPGPGAAIPPARSIGMAVPAVNR